MGRTILADSSLQKKIETFIEPQIGIIIGQVSLQKDFAVHLIRTPDKEDEDTSFKIDAVDDIWVATHAQQVKRMLPGGLDIIGVYAAGSPDVISNAQYKLKRILYAVHKAVSMNSSASESLELYTLLACTLTKKLTCRTFDVLDNKAAANPAEWKPQNASERWLQVQTQLALDVLLPISHDSTSTVLKKQLLMGLQPTFDNIRNSLGTVDSQMLMPDQLLDPQGSTSERAKKGKKKQVQEEWESRVFNVDFFQQSSKAVASSELMNCDAKICIRGMVYGCAYLHRKATVSEAMKALKSDVIDSIVARCELLCEDILQAEEEQDPRVLYETPLRLFAPLRDSGLNFCDYLFIDEEISNSVERFRDLVDVIVREDEIDADTERKPESEDLVKSNRIPGIEAESGSDSSAAKGKQNPLALGIGLALGALGAGVLAASTYLFFDQD
ncbi:hypothetical protein CAPTEDRAFT_220721 [Capitella teleta]|uniref:Protein odr-4 homolog n=1 Tax=Capitella teleta TaxID=283909 RepID=R7U985_CAPTE|nr:hypothetical protein CAPTEDRAFT_220721 [Capitella teleta]|eukprot:ELU02910.1 hypothetical protein CAPTEDRAFT_220721 [Capitella teleta]